MKTIVLAIYDTQLAAYANPWFQQTEGAAIRAFHDEAKNEKSPLHTHPEDYALYVLATFDDETGKFENEDAPRQIATGKQTQQH